MTVTEVRQALGAWELRLKDSTPRDVLDALTYFGHIAIVPGRLNVAQYGDALLAAARYVGVYTTKDAANDRIIKGSGMAFWLGDSDGKGDVFESTVTVTAANFSTAVAAALPPHGSILAGTMHSVPGTFTGDFRFTTPRKALDYITSGFGAEWKVRGDGYLDAGFAADLYAGPTCILHRREGGQDLRLKALSGAMALELDAQDYTTRVVLLAEGEAESIATGSANGPATAFNDIHGNDVWITRLVSESGTSAVDANTRAALALSQFESLRSAVSLSTDEFDIKGDLQPGDWLWVYDPDSGFYDTDNEVIWEGERINPLLVRCFEMQWPIRPGWTVAFRDVLGNWRDLSDYYEGETGQTTVGVGEPPRNIVGITSEPIGTRPAVDSSIPASPSFTGFNFGAYQSDLTNTTKAAIRAAWTTPLNGDGSTILDGSHYEIRYRVSAVLGYEVKWGQIGIPSGSPYKWGQLSGNKWGAPVSDPVEADPKWYMMQVAWSTNQATILELTPGVTYEIQIRAVDLNGHLGPYSASSFITAIGDLFAPSTPAAPTVAGSLIAIEVLHNLGKASGGTFNLEQDLDHLEVHVGGSASFYADDSSLVGKMIATAGMIQANIPAIASFNIPQTEQIYVKVRAVDRAGNKSGASAGATVSATLIDNAHISDLSVSKLTAGTITAQSVLAADIAVGTGGSVTVTDGRFLVRDSSNAIIMEIGKRVTDPAGGYGLTVFDPNNAGQVVLRMGRIADPNYNYGMEARNNSGQLVSMQTLAFGIQAATGFPGATQIFTDTFTDLGGVPFYVDVTVGTSGKCIIIFGAMMQQISNVLSYGGSVSFAVSGATTIAVDTNRVLRLGQTDNGINSGANYSNNMSVRSSAIELLTGLNPGVNRISLKFKCDASHPGTSWVYFNSASIVAIPY